MAYPMSSSPSSFSSIWAVGRWWHGQQGGGGSLPIVEAFRLVEELGLELEVVLEAVVQRDEGLRLKYVYYVSTSIFYLFYNILDANYLFVFFFLQKFRTPVHQRFSGKC